MSKRRRDYGINTTLWRREMFGHPFGLYKWTKGRGLIRGLVLRAGPLGHVQANIRSGRRDNGRRAFRTLQISFWGVRGRRGKRYLRLSAEWTLRSKPRPLN